MEKAAHDFRKCACASTAHDFRTPTQACAVLGKTCARATRAMGIRSRVAEDRPAADVASNASDGHPKPRCGGSSGGGCREQRERWASEAAKKELRRESCGAGPLAPCSARFFKKPRRPPSLVIRPGLQPARRSNPTVTTMNALTMLPVSMARRMRRATFPTLNCARLAWKCSITGSGPGLSKILE